MDGVVSLDEFKDLKKKIEHLEYDEIKTIKEEVSDMKNNMTRTETLLEQNIKYHAKCNHNIKPMFFKH